jgi:alkyl sulfatase BDS1-like metallo-beta-lactamase superfamily hydrolase
MNDVNKDRFEWLGEFPTKTFADGKGLCIAAMGTSAVIDTDEGLVVFDIGTYKHDRRIFTEIRKFSDKQIKYIIYSHGHFDHCFGYKFILEEIKEKGWEMPVIIGHENVLHRFEKYRILDKYHEWINSMQFASVAKSGAVVSAHETLDPTKILQGNDTFTFKLGQFTFEIYHDKGETDDSLWMYIPELKTICAGELVANTYPNLGNPYKVQRYPKHWAIAMERMLEKDAEYLIRGHGPFIEGKEKVKECLSVFRDAMHFVHDEVVKRLNEGKWFEQIYHEMLEIYPDRLMNSEYLKPIYGCYRFAIHAAYRLYHGWYNTGNATDLFPAKAADISKELLKLNSVKTYLEHAKKLFNEGKSQLALHILDIVIKSEDEISPTELLLESFQLKSQILKQKVKDESSFIAANIINAGVIQLRPKIKELRKKLK